jgi:hypothetical protein
MGIVILRIALAKPAGNIAAWAHGKMKTPALRMSGGGGAEAGMPPLQLGKLRGCTGIAHLVTRAHGCAAKFTFQHARRELTGDNILISRLFDCYQCSHLN